MRLIGDAGNCGISRDFGDARRPFRLVDRLPAKLNRCAGAVQGADRPLRVV